MTKRNLIDGGCTFQLNVRQTYKASEGQCQYQIRKPHHLHVHNLKTLMRYNPYAHVVSYVLLVDPLQVPNKEAFDMSNKQNVVIHDATKLHPRDKKNASSG